MNESDYRKDGGTWGEHTMEFHEDRRDQDESPGCDATEKHHPSCRPSDKDLVWHCSQCGINEHATAIEEAATALADALRGMASLFGEHARGSYPDTLLGRTRAALAQWEEAKK